MIKLRLFWRWTVIIVWNHKVFHVHRNPVKKKEKKKAPVLVGNNEYLDKIMTPYPRPGE